jgi:hypothetical protein
MNNWTRFIICVLFFVTITCGCFFREGNRDMTTSEVYLILERSPFWWDLAVSPIGWSTSGDVDKGLITLCENFEHISHASTKTIRAAIVLYLNENNPDKAACKNHNILVLNRFLFKIDDLESYPIDVENGTIIIRPASPVIRTIDVDSLHEFDKFTIEKPRRKMNP